MTGLPNAYVCDGSLLRAAGIANSGLTLVALTYRLAEILRAQARSETTETAERTVSATTATPPARADAI